VGSGQTADDVTSVMIELKKEFGVSELEIQEAILAGPLLCELWPDT
jgi:hypothetical protein